MRRPGDVVRGKTMPQTTDGLQEIVEPMPQVANARVVEQENTLLVEYVGERDQMGDVLQRLVGEGISVTSFSEEEADLEDIFMKMTRGIVS